MTSTILLESHFSSAHLYHQPQWSDQKNTEVFGRCFTKHGHGHNYKLVAEFEAPDDVLALRQKLDEVVKALDHEHLNFVIPEFKNKIPTTEVICEYFRDKIQSQIPIRLLNLELFETEDIGSSLY